MGDIVESMRFFDPSNQRSLDPISEIMVCPIQMSPPDDDSMEHGLDKLVQVCESRGVERRIRQGLLDDFRHRIRFPGVELYLSVFQRPSGNIA